MYYAYDLFVKKGPLAKLWIAGTFFRKLTKAQYLASDLKLLCKSVEKPPTPLALPAQSTLLRGVCRIENKCVGYLLSDAIDAKTKLFVKEGMNTNVDLPQNQLKARYDQITYPDTDSSLTMDDLLTLRDANLDNYDIYAGDEDYVNLDLSRQAQVYNERSEEQHKLYQANPEDITLEDASSINLDILGDSDLGSMHRDSDVQDMDFNIQDDILQAENQEEQGMLSSDIDQLQQTPDIVQSEAELGYLDDEIVHEEPARHRKRKFYQLQIDENTELSDEVMITSLQDTLDLLKKRPCLKKPQKDSKQELAITLRQPLFLPIKYLAPELVETFKKCTYRYTAPTEDQPPHYDEDIPLEYEQDGVNMFDQTDIHQRSDHESDSRFHSDAEIARDVARDSDMESVYSEGIFGALDVQSDDAKRRKSARDSLLVFDDTGLSSEVGSPDARSRSGTPSQPYTPYNMEVELLTETPDMMNSELNLSQMELPVEEIKGKRLSQGIRAHLKEKPEISRFTKIFKGMLEKRFDEEKSTVESNQLIMESVLRKSANESNLKLTRRDVALSFYQVLVLKSLDIIDVEQKQSFGDIFIKKGDMWNEDAYRTPVQTPVA